MFFLAIGLVVAWVAVCFGLLYWLVSKKLKKTIDRSGLENKNLIKEIETKKELLKRMGVASLGLIQAQGVVALRQQQSLIRDQIASEEQSAVILNTENATLDGRLRELEEAERELEISSFEAAKELAELRSEEDRIAHRNMKMRQELTDSLGKIDTLLSQLQHSREAVDRLSKAKSELVNMEEKIDWYEQEIIEINGRYGALKNAYDALDIEYAQLYEKQ